MIGEDSFWGFARIDLDAFYFDHSTVAAKRRRESKKNVDRLTLLFQKVGCENDLEENAVIATLAESDLRESLGEIDREELPRTLDGDVDVPMLHVPRVNGIQGLHRIAAAKKLLKGANRWWLVRLYSLELRPSDLTKLATLFGNEQQETDGEIFRNVLLHKGTPEEAKWRGRLVGSPAKLKDLNQLLRNERFVRAFRKVTPVRALWLRLELGSLHRFLTLHCDEEILTGLEHVHHAWNHILEGLPDSMLERIDVESIQFVECLAPAASDFDRSVIEKKMASGELFPRLQGNAVRQRVLGKLLAYEHMIPTLRFLFDGLKQFEPACDIMKRIAGVGTRATIRQCFFDSCDPGTTGPVELGEGVWHKGKWLDNEARRYFLYVQLFVYALRHCYYMSHFYAPRKEAGKAKPKTQRPNAFLEQRIGRLGVASGFRTETAIEWAQRNPVDGLFKQLSDDVEIGLGAALKDDVKIGIMNGLPEKAQTTGEPVSLLGPEDLMIERRNGRPFDDDYHNDRKAFFLHTLLRKDIQEDRLTPQDVREYRTDGPHFITSLFARRDLLYFFFGVDLDRFLPIELRDDFDDVSGGGPPGEGERPSASEQRNANPASAGSTPPGSQEVADTPMLDAHTVDLETLRAKVAGLERCLRESQMLVGQRNQELAEARQTARDQQLREEKEMSEKLAQARQIALEEKTAWEAERVEMMEELTKSKEKIAELKAKVEASSETLEQSLKSRHAADAESTQLQQELATSRVELHELRSQFASLSELHKSQGTALSERKAMEADLQSQMTQLKLERELLQKEREQKEREQKERELSSVSGTFLPITDEPIPRYDGYSQELLQLIPLLLETKEDDEVPDAALHMHIKYRFYTLHFTLRNGHTVSFVDTSDGPVLRALLEAVYGMRSASVQLLTRATIGSEVRLPPNSDEPYVKAVLNQYGSLWVNVTAVFEHGTKTQKSGDGGKRSSSRAETEPDKEPDVETTSPKKRKHPSM